MSPKQEVPITINVTARKEGILLYKTLKSVIAGYNYAQSKGTKNIQFNVGLDNPDEETLRVAKEISQNNDFINLFTINEQDLSANRNLLLSKSNGEYVVFINGGDLLSENFLYEAYSLAQKNKETAIYSADFCIGFGVREFVYQLPDFNYPYLNLGNIIEHNYFRSPLFASSDIYKKIKFLPSPSSGRECLKRWQWSCDAISRDYKIFRVPGTVFFERQNSESSQDTEATIGPSLLFSPKNFIKLRPYLTVKTNLAAQSQERVRSSADIKRSVRKHLVSTLKQFTNDGSSSTYHFIRDQYFLNRRYVAYLMSRVGIGSRRKGDKELLKIIKKSYKNDSSVIPQKLTDIGVDMKVLTEWAKINQYEPMIRPSQDILDEINVFKLLKESLLANKYLAFCETYQDINFTDLVLVNHLVKGGADLAAINLIKVLSEDLGKRVLVLTTDNIESPWASELSGLNNVTLLELKDYCEELSNEQKMKLILKILQNWGISRLSIINSPLGYELLRIYGNAIDEVCKVFLHVYAYDMTEDGFIYNVIQNGLVDAYPYIDHFVTDSQGFKAKLIEVNGFSDEKIQPVYLPIKNNIKPLTKTNNTKKVLWASRISHAKLVEVAAAVATLIQPEGLELHMYGVIDPEYKHDNLFKKLIKDQPNIKYHGAYNNFADIDYQNYDIFLLTSKNEGMPNVILEAVMANLFIVAAKVGGIPEIITDGKNGFLVEDNFYPQEYAQKIIDYYKNSKLWDPSIRLEANKDIVKRHSWAHYKEDIKNLYN